MRPVLIVDNYDSFTFNLVQMIGADGFAVQVERNDHIDPDSLAKRLPHAVVISPGPGRCEKAGRSVQLIERLSDRVPILGVCLGHQAIGVAFGARIAAAPAPVHGKASSIEHDGSPPFERVSSPFLGARYHSLVIDESSLQGSPLVVTARSSSDGLLMAIRHRTLPTFGLQFHPESVLTSVGGAIVHNFLTLAGVLQC